MKFKDYIILALIAIGLFLWWRGCHPKKVTPVQVTIKELIHDTIIQNKANARITDSFNRVIQYKDAENSQLYDDFTRLLNENQALQTPVINVPVIDTCKALDKAWQDKYSNFARQTGKTTLSAQRTIQGLQGTIGTQKQFMAAKDTALNKTKALLSDCISSYKAVPKAKREISVGATLLGDWSGNLHPGVSLGFRSIKGWGFEAAVYTGKQGTITVRKSIIKW